MNVTAYAEDTALHCLFVCLFINYNENGLYAIRTQSVQFQVAQSLYFSRQMIKYTVMTTSVYSCFSYTLVVVVVVVMH